ncbi:MAG: AAA-like domain-containing protein [Fimbriimonadaceae bacterium]|nr:AAA-like domain-containing protein [Fimbriimonadaceae bacterium]
MDRQPPFFRPGGTMDPNAPSYLERVADAQLLDALVAGEYVFLLDSRQKGKSSLVARTMVKLKERGIDAVKLDLQRIGANVTPDQWYAGLVSGLGQELGLNKELFEYWGAHQEVGPLARWIGALESVVLPSTEHPIVIFIDEVDFVRALPFPTDEFFAGIRDCYNRRSEVRGFERLSFCLVGVATPGQLIRNPEITPFNIGTRIDLSDFALEETQPYAQVLTQSGKDGEQLTKRVHYWVNGHPYLTQLLCSQVACNPDVTSSSHVDTLVKNLFFTPESRMREPNLADVERRMLDPDVPGMSLDERKTQVLQLYGRLLKGKGVDANEENPVVVSLRLAGIGLEEKGNLRLRNRIYRTVFNEGWRQQSFPHAELRRIQGATRLATLRTAAVAAIILLVVSLGAASFYNIAKDRERALKTLTQRTKEFQEQNYIGLMANLRLGISENQWTKVSTLIRTSNDNPLRGWEWGHAAMFVNRHLAEIKLPKEPLALERQPSGALYGITSIEDYEVTPTDLKLLGRHTDTGVNPMYRRGDIRVGSDPSSNSLVFTNAISGKVLGKAKLRHVFFDFDPGSQTILGTLPGGNGDPFELLSFDGSRSIAKIAAPNFCIAARFLNDGTIVSMHQGGRLRRQDRSGKVLATAEGPIVDMNAWGRFALSQDGRYFAFFDIRYRRLEIRRSSDLSLVSTTAGPLIRTSCFSFSFDGETCAAGTSDGTVLVFDVKTGRLINTFVGHWLGLNTVEFMAGDRHLLTIDSGLNVKTWLISTPEPVEVHLDHKGQAEAPFLVNGGRNLISRSAGWRGEQELVSRDLDTGVTHRFSAWHMCDVQDAAVFVALRDGSIARLSPSTLEIQQKSKVFEHELTGLQVFDRGRKLFAHEYRDEVGSASNCAILDTSSLDILARFKLDWPADSRPSVMIAGADHRPVVAIGALSSNAVSTNQPLIGAVYLISGDTGQVMKRLEMDGPFSALQFSPDGKSLVIARHEAGKHATTPTIFDITAMKFTRTLPPALARSNRYLFDNSGRYLAGTSGSVLGSLWDFKEGRLIATLNSGGGMRSLSFSPDGSRIVTGATNRTTTIWDTRSGAELFSLRYTPLRKDDQSGDTLNDSSIFSPDGTQVILACTDGAVRVFNSIPWKDQASAERK